MPPKRNTLTSYFQMSPNGGEAKRRAPENDDLPPGKKRDTEGRHLPEQAERMQLNRLSAEAKLWSKRLDAGTIGATWMAILPDVFKQPFFDELVKFLTSERSQHTIYPPSGEVFSWTNACVLEDVKVVILGQDPYHGPNQAHGLCFSVKPGVPPPPSLINMYKELENDIDGFKRPNHGCLMGWAKQGVLLLNACLTVRQQQANSHQGKGWEKVTDAVIRWLNNKMKNVVFILWGSYAQKKGAFIDKKRHCVLKGVHPSPLSASRGFFGCKHFSQANKYLTENGREEIDWAHLPRSIDL